MKIKEITHSNRKKFKAIFECPLCHYTFKACGYADVHFYNDIMPNAICRLCGKNEKGETEKELVARVGCTLRI